MKKEDKGRPVVLVILILVIGLGVGVYYYLNHHKGGKDARVVDEIKSKTKGGYNYKLLSTKNMFDIKYDKYIIEYNPEDNLLYKISDFAGKVLFEGEQPYDEFILGVDNNMYVYRIEEQDLDNTVTLYKLNGKEFEEITKYHEKEDYVVPVKLEDISNIEDHYYLYDDFDYYLIGFYADFCNGTTESSKSSCFYSLKGDKKELKGISFKGDGVRLEASEAVVTYDKDYISYYAPNNSDDNDLEGIYSLKDMKVAVEATYDGVYYHSKGKYIVSKNKKSGIIDTSNKKLVNLEYDFIDDYEDYLVVSKNNKMAIMDKNYKVITDYFLKYPGGDFDYELCCANRNSFSLEKYGEKYIFFIDNDYLGYTGQAEDLENDIGAGKDSKNEVYIVNKDYSLEKTKANDYYTSEDNSIIFMRAYKEKKVYVYDNKVNLKFIINLSKYDKESSEVYFEVEGNVIYDLEAGLYFDLKTGKELDEHKIVREIKNVKLVYDRDHVDILLDDNKVHSVKTEYVLPVRNFANGIYVYYQNENNKDEIAIFTK